ncbi:MAG: DUF1828 domain-containing protein [Planctomycetes bacterium]|nr:DUF1828 domain-containing protein [Planctomycetota bacterium]
MNLTCTEATERFVASLQEGFSCQTLEDRIRIITPFIYPDNDLIEVFVEELTRDRIRVTDLGETMRHLVNQGLDVNASPKRRHMVDTIAAGTGVDVARGELLKEGRLAELGELLLDVMAAARGVSDLILTSRSYEPALFNEEVAQYLREHHIEYEEKVRLTGETGKIYRVAFKAVEANRYIETLSPNQPAGLQPVVNRVFRMWSDCNEQLTPRRKITVFNDVDFVWRQPEVALLSRVSTVSYWSQRDELVDLVRRGDVA